MLHETSYPLTSADQTAVTDALFLPRREVGKVEGQGEKGGVT